MRLGYGLNLEQSQKLIMTPELRQAIAILQLNTLELTTYVEEQMLENPLLEVQEENTENAQNKGPEEGPEVDPRADGEEKPLKSDIDWQEYFQQAHNGRVYAEQSNAEVAGNLEYFIAAAATLQEHLLEQLHCQEWAGPVKLAEYIIGNLNESGYLALSVEEIAREQRVSTEEAEQALAIVQHLDPPGIGARTLEECLRLQLATLGDYPPEMLDFLSLLEDLAAGRFQRIAHNLKISLQRVQELADLVRTLDPKPGARFPGREGMRYIVPDVVVEEVMGEYVILVNDTAVPRLRISQAYRQVLNTGEDQEARKFVEQKLNSAAWLIRSIEQRRLTLYKVARAIVDWQEEFLRWGIQYLKPLTLRDIAEEVGVHESTVSRATAGKYVQTPRGILEFKFFFATGVGDDPTLATATIRQKLKELIAAEDPKRPFSDQKLTELLGEKGMEISRRTVAKYRDELGIPVAAIRKRY